MSITIIRVPFTQLRSWRAPLWVRALQIGVIIAICVALNNAVVPAVAADLIIAPATVVIVVLLSIVAMLAIHEGLHYAMATILERKPRFELVWLPIGGIRFPNLGTSWNLPATALDGQRIAWAPQVTSFILPIVAIVAYYSNTPIVALAALVMLAVNVGGSYHDYKLMLFLRTYPDDAFVHIDGP
jgi:hypothetical protein